MKPILSRSIVILSILACMCAPSLAAGTLKIQNKWTGGNAPQLYLWLEYKASDSSNVKLDGAAVSTKKYIKVTGSDHTLTWDTIDAGNLSFVAFENNKIPTDPKTGTETKWSMDDNNSFGGFIEFTNNASDGDTIWADLSNVDGVGLLCGLDGLPNDQGKKAGYDADQQTFVKNLLAKFPTLPKSGKREVTIKGTTYTKVIAPGKAPAGQQPWKNIVGTYYEEIISKDRSVDLNIPNYNNGHWTGKQFAAGKTFTGIGIDDVPIAVHISADFSPKRGGGDPVYHYDIYIAKDKWTSETISKADGRHAVYIRTNNPKLPGFKGEPAGNPWGKPYKNSSGTLFGYDSMGINPILSTSSSQPFPIQSLAFAIARTCAMIQGGYINPKAGQPDSSIVYPEDTSRKHYGGNKYNEWILANSNSYGQPYSDGQARVLYTPKNSFNLYILGPDDATTKNYYKKGGGIPPVPSGPHYQLTVGGGPDCKVGSVTVGNHPEIKGDKGAFKIPGAYMNPNQWVPVVLNFPGSPGSHKTISLKLKKNPADYTGAPDYAQTVKTTLTNFGWSKVPGVQPVLYNLAGPPVNP